MEKKEFKIKLIGDFENLKAEHKAILENKDILDEFKAIKEIFDTGIHTLPKSLSTEQYMQAGGDSRLVLNLILDDLKERIENSNNEQLKGLTRVLNVAKRPYTEMLYDTYISNKDLPNYAITRIENLIAYISDKLEIENNNETEKKTYNDLSAFQIALMYWVLNECGEMRITNGADASRKYEGEKSKVNIRKEYNKIVSKNKEPKQDDLKKVLKSLDDHPKAQTYIQNNMLKK